MSEKLPTETKQFQRTHRPSRDRQGLEAGARLTEVPEPPENLFAGAAEHWRELAPLLVGLELLTAADLPALKLTCKTLATVDALESCIQSEGFTIEAATGGRKAHPALKALETQRNAAARLLSDFGLSPKSRKFVSPAPERRADNPFTKLARLSESRKLARGENVFAHLEDDE